ncbi:predicted protein [Naegleria gruberi]|uniref:Predicted protein n=1 Tax=Naegleria gruberi TaxID=5762 RepID=D2VQX3_NAEGR|nr:uncharacterized protein NAEGRDRAFT_71378 [Naegleria gruberi]EFC40711.1 predicted protein [Naegleria gruberi]|eukprot:XP_002673455.1 predicted protein [Naegleria gruberi strain NEG-M]
MHQDCWAEIIPFLQPIDVLASLLTINHSLHNLIKKLCIVTFDRISQFTAGCCSELKISFNCHDDFENIEKINHDVPIYGNVKYFIRLYLLKLSLKLGNQDPENGDLNVISDILNSSELKLLNFYRSVFTEFKFPQQKNPSTIAYCVVGEAGVGTCYFCEFVRFGKKSYSLRYGFESFYKKFTIPNEIEWQQQIWIPDGSERFYSKQDVIQRYKKYDKSMYILPCFSMNYETSFQTVGDWVSIIRDTLGIIVGLSTTDFSLDPLEEKKVSLNDAVRKAFELGFSVFVESDDNHIFTPFWFIQLQSTYFTFNKNDNWDCSLM